MIKFSLVDFYIDEYMNKFVNYNKLAIIFHRIMAEDRQIQPNQRYLQELAQRQRQQNPIKVHQYLKKSQNPVLSCIRQRPKSNADKKPYKKQLTKAQIFEIIKAKNKSKFGELKKQQPQQQTQILKKKIRSQDITVQYKPKQPIIHIQQYKHPNYKKPEKNLKETTENQMKVNYQKMLERLQRQMLKLQHQKAQFQQEKEYLKFKKIASIQENPIRPIVSYNTQNIAQKKGQAKIQQTKENSRLKQNKQKQVIQKLVKAQSNFVSCLKSKTTFKTKKDENKQLIKLPIQRLNQLPDFQLVTIASFVELNNLNYYANYKYLEAEKCLCQSQRLNVEQIGQKRVTKFEGWVEVWTPGKQRVVSDEKGYILRWFANGDVKQSFSSGVQSYYSKQKNVVQINLNSKCTFYYFPDLNQIQKMINNNKGREVIFGDGRHEIVNL